MAVLNIDKKGAGHSKIILTGRKASWSEFIVPFHRSALWCLLENICKLVTYVTGIHISSHPVSETTKKLKG